MEISASSAQQPSHCIKGSRGVRLCSPQFWSSSLGYGHFDSSGANGERPFAKQVEKLREGNERGFVTAKERLAMTFRLTSPAFESGEDIPNEFTCDGPDSSPPLIWTDPPPGTETLALIVDDPDAPSGTWVHWVLYNLPATARGLSEGVAKDRQLPDGARQGGNNFGKLGYNGPCPPRGRPTSLFFQ